MAQTTDKGPATAPFRSKVMSLLQDQGLLSEERTELLLSWRHIRLSAHTRVRSETDTVLNERPAA